jgi:CHAT domain-containing protein
LESNARGLGGLAAPAVPPSAENRTSNELDAIREARRELDEVIKEIQAVPGFESFLAAPTFEDIAGAASQRPIVYISPAGPGGLALIVGDGGVSHVELNEISTDAVRERVTPYLEAYSQYRDDPEGRLKAWTIALDGMLRWLWESVMAPILEEVQADSELVLVAGGLLGLVPLHAAWTEDAGAPSGRRYALDRAVISYAPNARAVTAASAVAQSASSRKALVIVDPQPVSADSLEWAAVEGEVAAACSEGAILLSGGKATVSALRREVEAVGILHLACHGVADLDAPLDSGLLLAGNQWITLRELMGLKLQIRLAVLSACETSLPGTELPDEVVALPTGLLQAGVAGVIASQWAVPELGTAILMAEFYRQLRGATPAAALRAAQQWIRDTSNDEKLRDWQRTPSTSERWPPQQAAEELIDQLEFADPDAHDHVAPRAWAAFAHVGV